MKTKEVYLKEACEKLEAAKVLIGRLKRSMLVHPDCEQGSEFDEYTSMAQQFEDGIELFLKEDYYKF